jgi:hypothetical protein
LPGLRFQRREYRDERRRRRSLNPLWLFFYLILIIIMLGLIFGGYRKGTPIKNGGLGAPPAPVSVSAPADPSGLSSRA